MTSTILPTFPSAVAKLDATGTSTTEAGTNSERASSIGASDIPMVLGYSGFGDATDLWKRKLNRDVESMDERSKWAEKYAQWGKRIEPVILERYKEGLAEGEHMVRGFKVKSKDVEHFTCTPDGVVCVTFPDGPKASRGVEVKNRGFSQKSKWDGCPPDDILAQVHWSMMVTGLKLWDIGVLIGGNTYRSYRVESSRMVNEVLAEVGETFWLHVLTEQEPLTNALAAVGRGMRQALRSTVSPLDK